MNRVKIQTVNLVLIWQAIAMRALMVMVLSLEVVYNVLVKIALNVIAMRSGVVSVKSAMGMTMRSVVAVIKNAPLVNMLNLKMRVYYALPVTRIRQQTARK